MSKDKSYKKSEFPLFNDDALKSSTDLGLKTSSIENNRFVRFNDGDFNQKINMDQNSDILRKKRGRKSNVESKDIEDPNITLKEIIENQKAGIPTEREKKMKEDRLKKMHEKRNEKKMIKNMDMAFLQLESDKKPNSSGKSTEEKSISNLEPNPNENNPSNGRALKIVDGKIQLIFEDEPGLKTSQLASLAVHKPEKTTSMSFRHRNHTEKWTADETKKFFRALEFFGSDFSMIAKFFPLRNRAQIKNKYRKEERENPECIDKAFKRHRISDKLKIKDRLANLNNMIENSAQDNSTDFPENNEEIKKNMSNSSTDSTDMKIIDEIINICKNEELEMRAKGKSLLLKDFEKTEIPTPSTNSVQGCEKSQESLTSYNLLSNL